MSTVCKSLSELEDTGKVLGSGNFGVVKLVKHKTSGVYYALKVVAIDLGEDFHAKKLMELKTLHQVSCFPPSY